MSPSNKSVVVRAIAFGVMTIVIALGALTTVSAIWAGRTSIAWVTGIATVVLAVRHLVPWHLANARKARGEGPPPLNHMDSAANAEDSSDLDHVLKKRS